MGAATGGPEGGGGVQRRRWQWGRGGPRHVHWEAVERESGRARAPDGEEESTHGWHLESESPLTLAKGGFGETDAPPPPPSSGAEPEDLLTQRIRALLDAEEKAKAEGKPLPGESQ